MPNRTVLEVLRAAVLGWGECEQQLSEEEIRTALQFIQKLENEHVT